MCVEGEQSLFFFFFVYIVVTDFSQNAVAEGCRPVLFLGNILLQ